MVAYPDRGAGNDPFFLLFLGVGGGGSLSPPRLNIFTVGNMEVMICLGQGGLRSLSASSFYHSFITMTHINNRKIKLSENFQFVITNPPGAGCNTGRGWLYIHKP